MSVSFGMGLKEIFDEDYWDGEATTFKLPCSWSRFSDLDLYSELDKWMKILFAHSKDFSLFEIGCAPGRYLAFFGKRYGCKLYGIDKSEVGVEATRKNLELQGLTGKIESGDFFHDVPELRGMKFDITMSHGFVEHFDDLRGVMAKIHRCTQPGGLIVTTAPNFNGLSGSIAKRITPDVYASHRKFTPSQLAAVQTELGARILFRGYTGHYHIRQPFRANTRFKKEHQILSTMINFPFLIFKGCFFVSWIFLRWILPPNRILSKRVSSIALKQQS
jgi:SAM-dependent methyltransferase